jgi:cytoskeletal protein RodZ
MAGAEQIKAAKLLGKHLRKEREKQGFNLAILASTLKLTVVEIVAIEDGNLYAFDHCLEKFSEFSGLYAKTIGVDLTQSPDSIEKITSVTANEWDVAIPAFLKKKD